MFTGVGGFELGIEQAYEKLFNEMEQRGRGQAENQLEATMPDTISKPIFGQHTTCIGFSEIDKYASQLLSVKWPHVKNYGDATTINENELPDFDLLVGGFPCQSFSVAGKRKGFDDTRGTLFFDIARILAHKRPEHLVLENVKGLLSHDGGRTFQTIIRVLTDLGYFIEWQVLNSKNFGVPQNRERVLIVGHLGGKPRRQVFPIGESTNKDINQLNQPRHSNNRVYGSDGISPTLNTMQGGMRQPKILNPLKGKTDYGWHFEQGVYDKKGITRSVKAGEGSGNKPKVIDSTKIRRLTPLECERLQGFPDNWTKDFSDTQRYKMMGNAVTVNVVKYVINKLFL